MPRKVGTAPAHRERIIKRYGNRKLYDPAARRYVTLDDLAAMVGRGEDLRVVDRATGQDLTTVVLAQVILEGLKLRKSSVPWQVLARIIRLSMAPAAAWTEWLAPQEAAARARAEAERIVSGLTPALQGLKERLRSFETLLPTGRPVARKASRSKAASGSPQRRGRKSRRPAPKPRARKS